MTLELRDVSHRYPRERKDVLHDVNLVVPTDESATIAVLGLSGSGKSTLLSLMGLLWEQPSRGTITYTITQGGTSRRLEYGQLRSSERTWLRRQHFGIVLQSSYLIPHLSCAQNLAVPLALTGHTARQSRIVVDYVLRRADELAHATPEESLFALRRRPARNVSGGQKQRIAVLRALIHDPHILFADEPVSNLDFTTARAIQSLIEQWQSGKLHAEIADRLQKSNSATHSRTLLLVNHSVEHAFRWARYFIVVQQGRVVGLAEENEPKPKRCYSGPEALYSLIEPQEESTR